LRIGLVEDELYMHKSEIKCLSSNR